MVSLDTMDLPPLSLEQLSIVLTSAPTPSDLYDTLSEYEDQACLLPTTDSTEQLLSVFYTTFFFSHLLTDQIYEARALTKRMPQDLVQKVSSLQNCLILLRAVWQRQYDQVYKILRELPWPETCKLAVQSYETYFQEKTLKEVSNSYEAIRPAVAATYLGLDPTPADQGDSATIQKFTSCGWRWDAEKRLLYPKPIATAPPKDDPLDNELSRVMALISSQGS